MQEPRSAKRPSCQAFYGLGFGGFVKLAFCRGLDGGLKNLGHLSWYLNSKAYSNCYYIGSYVGDPDLWKVSDYYQKYSLVARI